MATPGFNRGDAPVEGEHAFYTVRMRAYPHDTVSIPAADFDPFKHQIARTHRAPAVAADPAPVRAADEV